jgi:hypothetical protein
MNRYRVIKLPLNNWIGFFQTNLNFKNIFIISWVFINTKMHDALEFSFVLFGFIIPIINKHRSLFSFSFYTWGAKHKGAMVSFSFFWLPQISFRI